MALLQISRAFLASPETAATFFYPLKAPVPRSQFEKILNTFPGDIYRIKGFIRFLENSSQLFTFQKVGRQSELLMLPVEISGAPLGLVFIGPQLDVNSIKSTLDPWASSVAGGTRLPLISS